MLHVVAELVEALNAGGVRYCHWKSNWALEESVRGDADLDLLVHRQDAARFRAMAASLGFRPVIDAANPPFPAVEHFYALDPSSGALAHVHAYYRVITGQSLAKNYRLPVEAMLLENTRETESRLRVPSRGAELIVFTLRMLVKHTSPFELVLLRRQRKRIRAEAAWLLDAAALESARELLPQWLPQLDVATFEHGVRALQRPASLARRIALGFRIRRRLRPFARYGAVRAEIVEVGKFVNLLSHRLRGSKKGLTPVAGGAVIAFVGSEATGKSTLANETATWLGSHFTVDRVHAGKPPGTALTFLPNLLVPLMRRLAPSSRLTARESRADGAAKPPAVGMLFALRAVSLAWDRRAVLIKAHAHAAKGWIVLCDRYPSRAGEIDGPQLGHLLAPSRRGAWLRWLARLEARLYADVPRPDLVIHLAASLETTLVRNRARDKTEAETYVRRRYTRAAEFTFDQTNVRRVDTARSLRETIDEVKVVIWDTLLGGRAGEAGRGLGQGPPEESEGVGKGSFSTKDYGT